MTNDLDLLIVLQAEQKKLGQEFDKTIKQLSGMEKKLDGVGNKAKKTGTKIQDAFKRANKVVVGVVRKWGALLGTAGFVGTMVKAVGAANKFQKSMAEVSTLLGKDAGPKMKKFDKAIKDLAQRSSSTATELSKGLYQVISAGTKGTKDAAGAMKLLEAAQKAAVAGVSNVFAAVDLLTTSLNAYQLSADEATKFSDILFTTVKLGKINFNELAAGMGTVASSAAGAGVSFEEVNAALAAMTAGGVPPARAITALNAIIRMAARGSEELDEAFGETTSNILKRDGLVGVLQKLKDETGGSTIALQKLKIEQEAVTGLAVLASSGIDKFKSALEEMQNSTGATEVAYKKMAATFDEQTKMFKNQVNIVMIELGNKIMPVLLEKMKEISAWISANSDKIIGFFTAAMDAVVGFGEWILAHGKEIAQLFVAMFTVGPIIKFISWIGKAKVAILLLLSPIGLVIAAATAMAILFENPFEHMKRLKNETIAAEKAWNDLMKTMGVFDSGLLAKTEGGFTRKFITRGGEGKDKDGPGKKLTDAEKKKRAAMVAARAAAENMLQDLRIKNMEEEDRKREEIIVKRTRGIEKLLALEKKGIINVIQMLDGIKDIRENSEKDLTKLRDDSMQESVDMMGDAIKKFYELQEEGSKKASLAMMEGISKWFHEFEKRWDAIIERTKNDLALIQFQISNISPTKRKIGASGAKIGGAELETEEERKHYAKFEVGPEEESEILGQVATGFMEQAGSMLFNWAGTLVTTLAGGKDAVEGLVNSAVGFWESLAENLDEALIFLAEEGIPKIIDAVISNLPKITVAIIKSIPMIVAAIASAVFNALSELLSLGIGGAGGDAVGGALTGAGLGAAAGSVIPGVGTAVGAGVGAIIGGIASLFHEGGLVKASKNLSGFGDAIRAHSGMFVQPLGGSEVPAILEAGEGVIRKEIMAAMGGEAAINSINAGRGAGGNVVVNNLNVNHMLSDDTPKVLDRMNSDSYRKGIGRMTQIIDGERVAGLETVR